MVIYLERGADLHMAQLMPLPLIVSCSSKIQIVFTFLVPVYPGCPGKEAVKWLLFNRDIRKDNLDLALARSKLSSLRHIML